MSDFEPETESQATRHFIELATRPLEDQPEIRDEARAELMGRLQAQDPQEREAALDEALPKLAKVIPGSWKGKAIALGIVWLLLACAVGWQGYGVFREFKTTWDIRNERISRFMGYPGTSSFPAAWESSATNPAALEEEIREHGYGIGEVLPTNFEELRKKIDPDNGAWPLLEAKKWNNVFLPNGPPLGPEGEVEEQGTRHLMEEAANAPRFEIYGPAARVARMQRNAPPETMLDLNLRANDFASFGRTEGPPAAMLAEQANALEKKGNKEGLRKTIRLWERLCVRLADTSLGLRDFNPAVNLAAAGLVLADPAKRLGMTTEEARIRKQAAEIDSAAARTGTAEPGYPMTLRNQIIPGTEPDAAACVPGREMEYAFVERVLAAVAAILLLLTLAGVGFECVRRGRRVNGLASGLSSLFTGGDGLWMLGLGVLVPIAWYWGITRLTPFGGRDLAIAHLPYPGIFASALAGLLLLLSLVVQTARWRIARRTALLGTAPKWLWPGWVIVAIAAILVPLPGAVRWLPSSAQQDFFVSTGVACGIPLLWLLWRAGAVLFSPGTNALGGVLLSRALALPLLLATIFVTGAYAYLQQREKQIIATDPVVGWDAAHASTRQEARSVEHLKRRFHEVFEDGSGPPSAR